MNADASYSDKLAHEARRDVRAWGKYSLAVVLGGLALVHAASLGWLCDDSFASFRYARNWARGLGLVFNAHERVEGISNPLWTLLLGVASRLGFDIERASIVLGIGAYVTCVVWLALACKTRPRGFTAFVPVGALLCVADPDWATFATGGLETSAFSLGVLASYLFAWFSGDVRIAGALAGACVAVTGMLRPDGGLLLVPLALAFSANRRRGLLPYLVSSVLPLGLFHLWRRHYYGAWLPNTYYAKSAFLSWWSQGLVYAEYFAIRHLLLIGLALGASVVVALSVCRERNVRPTDGVMHRLAVAWAMVLVYSLGVIRVGGDFMYARMLVPVLPLLVVVFELSLSRVLMARPMVLAFVGLLTASSTFATPCPVDTDIVAHHGVVDERAYYQLGFAHSVERSALQLRECIQGYPARAAIYGGELRLAYRADIPYVVEAHAGLMDPVVAHKRIGSRHRIGHEKSADAHYLVMTKQVHFATSPLYGILSDKTGFIPDIHADLCGVDVRLLHWDPAFVAFVRARGAIVPDVTRWLDALILRLDVTPESAARAEWQAVWHFYFAYNRDPVREAAFQARLRRGLGGSTEN